MKITGTPNYDRISLDAGNDEVDGLAGDDHVFKFKSGSLVYDGGAGSDFLHFQPEDGDFVDPSKGAIVDLTKGTGTNPYGGAITLISVEYLWGTFLGDDFRGNDLDNTLYGNRGADRLRGEGGDDLLWVDINRDGSASHATVDGGSGRDTLMAYGDGAETLNRLDILNQNLNDGAFEGGQFINLEEFNLIGGINTSFVFDIRGGDAAETIRTGDGADSIDGRGGSDIILGQGGGDVLDGGVGIDTLDYSITSGSGAGVAVDIGLNTASGGDAQGDKISNFENLSGSNRNDVLTGSLASNVIRSTTGNDTISGNGGNDTIIDSGGHCLISGGSGNDAISSPDSFNDRVRGNTGNDNISGSSSDDLIGGDDGNDRIVGNLGQDRLIGGHDSDRFVFASVFDSAKTRAAADIIVDFNDPNDVIDVSAIDARSTAAGDNVFGFIGTAGFTAEGQLRVASVNGNTYVELNTTGAAGPESIIRLNGLHTLAAPDFIL